MQYFDKNGKEIKAGMKILMDDGTVLIHELASASSDLAGDVPPPRDIITDVIGYINANLTKPLSLELICKEFYFSKAQINRKFKKVTGSTVWEYILAKRLLLAKELLRAGNSPSTVCTRSGFNDYCTFFRAYKAQFGVSPRADHNRDAFTHGHK